jgi:hypothetical protein
MSPFHDSLSGVPHKVLIRLTISCLREATSYGTFLLLVPYFASALKSDASIPWRCRSL